MSAPLEGSLAAPTLFGDCYANYAAGHDSIWLQQEMSTYNTISLPLEVQQVGTSLLRAAARAKSPGRLLLEYYAQSHHTCCFDKTQAGGSQREISGGGAR